MKRELIYAALIGGIVGALAISALRLFLPMHFKDLNARTITCREIEVVDNKGTKLVRIDYDKDGGQVLVKGKENGSARLSINTHGGVVAVRGDKGFANLGTDEHSGYVSASRGLFSSDISMCFNKDGKGGVYIEKVKHTRETEEVIGLSE